MQFHMASLCFGWCLSLKRRYCLDGSGSEENLASQPGRLSEACAKTGDGSVLTEVTGDWRGWSLHIYGNTSQTVQLMVAIRCEFHLDKCHYTDHQRVYAWKSLPCRIPDENCLQCPWGDCITAWSRHPVRASLLSQDGE